MTQQLSTTKAHTALTYLRTSGSLPPDAVADLQAFFAVQRAYYGIPEGHPVYPPRPKESTPAVKTAPAKDARNGVNHPWRSS